MLKVGITGGIGSGKTTVCRLFELLGIPVFYADDAARRLMDEDATLIASIKQLLGDAVYSSTGLNRKLVGELVFSDPGKLAQLNALVHPVSIAYANDWMNKQQSPYTLKEAAIFFETGAHAAMDIMIGVDAPETLRIDRAMQRSHLSREEVMARIARQMNNDEKMLLCDYVVVNDGIQALIPQVLALHEQLLQRAGQ